MTKQIKLAGYLETTNLNKAASRDTIKKLCDEAKQYHIKGICIDPHWVGFAKNRVKGTGILVGCVPNWEAGGGLKYLVKMAEEVLQEADYVDYILNVINAIDLKAWNKTKEELALIRQYTKGELKIIIESYYLRKRNELMYKMGDNLIKEICKLVTNSGADFIKSDSGLFKRPTQKKEGLESLYEDCKLLRKYTGKKLGVKIAGGVSTAEQCYKLIELGATRIGTSKAVAILKDAGEIYGS